MEVCGIEGVVCGTRALADVPHGLREGQEDVMQHASRGKGRRWGMWGRICCVRYSFRRRHVGRGARAEVEYGRRGREVHMVTFPRRFCVLGFVLASMPPIVCVGASYRVCRKGYYRRARGWRGLDWLFAMAG